MMFNKKQERIRFLKFAFVGIIGAVIDFGLFNLLRSLFGMPSIYASAISFTAAVSSNFVWNRYWTYPDSRSKSLGRQLMQFFIISVIGLGIRTVSITPLQNLLEKIGVNLPLPTHTITTLAANGALAFLIGVVMLWNFFANRFWTYNDVVTEE
jgi:putative flippase GtrA